MSGMELDEENKEDEEERSVTCRDIKLIMPTVLILLFTLFVMVEILATITIMLMVTISGDCDPVCIFISDQAASSSDGS